MKPKILVGCPTSIHKEYCLKEYIKGLKSLTYPNLDILLVDNSKNDKYFKKIRSLNIPVIKGPWFEGARKRIYESRNLLREKVLKENYDYFLSLEQDIIPPENIIEQLLKYNKKIISGIYYSPGTIFTDRTFDGKIMPLAWVEKDNRNTGAIRILTPEEVKDPKLMKIKVCGLGCVLIHKDVLKKLRFRCDEFFGSFDDIWFCRDAKANSFNVYLDTSVKCRHLVKNRKYSWVDMKW